MYIEKSRNWHEKQVITKFFVYDITMRQMK